MQSFVSGLLLLNITFLRFIYVIECISSLFIFIDEYYSLVGIYHDLFSMNIWIISRFWLFLIELLGTFL